MSTVEGKTLTKKKALKDLLSEGSENFMSITSVGTTRRGDTFSSGGCEYLILTDREANEKTEQLIRETVDSFSNEFIERFVSYSVQDIEAIKNSSNSNAILTDAIESGGRGMCNFIDKALEEQGCGRGHFLSPYDGEEKEVGNYFIYRIN